jgi:hypothetical protein
MPRINPTVTEEARKIYDNWKDDKKANTSMAIIMFEQRGRGGLTLTETDKEWIRQEIAKINQKP